MLTPTNGNCRGRIFDGYSIEAVVCFTFINVCYTVQLTFQLTDTSGWVYFCYRRNPRLLMIEQNMVEWLVARLRGECERLYSLEYSTALLLNLCLHVEARERCPESVLKLLTDLLDTGQIQVTVFI